MLDEFNKALKLYRATAPEIDYTNIVNLNVDQIRVLDKEDCFEYANLCMQYAIYLQRSENRERARLAVCENFIWKLAAKTWNDIEFFGKAEVRCQVLAQENPKLRQYLDEKANIEARVQEISGLANLTQRQAEIYKEMARSK